MLIGMKWYSYRNRHNNSTSNKISCITCMSGPVLLITMKKKNERYKEMSQRHIHDREAY